MHKLAVIVILGLFAGSLARPATQEDAPNVSCRFFLKSDLINLLKCNIVATVGVPFHEEVVVESSLTIRAKDKPRQKRQFEG